MSCNKLSIYHPALILAFLLILLSPSINYGQNNNYKFKYLTVDDGLSHRTVYNIIRDSKGFLWVATRGGLNRYDGAQFKVFRHQPENKSSLSCNIVRIIHEDSRGNIWLGTEDKGVDLYLRNKDKFYNYPLKAKSESNDNLRVKSIYEDSRGEIWVANNAGLFRFDTKADGFILIRNKNTANRRVSYISSIHEDKNGYLWFGTRHGLEKYDLVNNSFSSYNDTFKYENRNSRICCIVEDTINNGLWLGTSNHGLKYFDLETKQYPDKKRLYKENNRLSSNNVSAMHFLDSNTLIICNTEQGVDIINLLNDSLSYSSEENNIGSISENTVSSVYEDYQNILWFGTWGNGICYLNKNQKAIRHYKKEFDNSGLNHNKVYPLLEDTNGNIWIGTINGLDYFDRSANKFYHNKKVQLDKEINGVTIRSGLIDSENNLWIGTHTGKVYLFDPNGNRMDFSNNRNVMSLGNVHIFNIYEDSHKNIWIGTWGNGLHLYNKQMGVFKKQANTGRFIRTIFEDSEKNLWLGTTQGLQLADSSKSNYTTFRSTEGDSNSLSNSAVTDIFEDKNGGLWIGTEYGLNHFNSSTKSFTRFNSTDGLPNNRIFGILEDDNNYLWISTSKGISKIGIGYEDGKNGTEKGKVFISNCTNYTSDDGLQSNQFNYSSRLKTKDGEMFFGGIKGLNSFYPEKIINNKFVAPVVIDDFKLFNNSVNTGDADSILHKAISETEEIVLRHDQSFFALEYAALNFESPTKNQYAHKLEGLDKDWIYTGNNRIASYTGIKPGNYIFRVKASNNDGVWNEEGTSIKITIKPPFWETTPAYIAYIIALLSIVLYFRHQFLARQKLKIQNELERINAKKNQEISSIKLQFFTNVSHELRTPLTLILGPLEKLIAEKPIIDSENRLPLYNLMQRNAQRLLRLVNQLLDFRKLEAGELRLKVSYTDIVAFIRNVANFFNFQAENRNIVFTINTEAEEKQAGVDPDKLEKIIFNLLSNAFKYTPDGGKIEINIRFDKDIVISISDNGIGIGKENLQNIFKRFYQVPKTQTIDKEGTGIGLALTKEMVELHKGQISVESEADKGTCFTIRIPTDLKPEKREQIIGNCIIPEDSW